MFILDFMICVCVLGGGGGGRGNLDDTSLIKVENLPKPKPL